MGKRILVAASFVEWADRWLEKPCCRRFLKDRGVARSYAAWKRAFKSGKSTIRAYPANVVKALLAVLDARKALPQGDDLTIDENILGSQDACQAVKVLAYANRHLDMYPELYRAISLNPCAQSDLPTPESELAPHPEKAALEAPQPSGSDVDSTPAPRVLTSLTTMEDFTAVKDLSLEPSCTLPQSSADGMASDRIDHTRAVHELPRVLARPKLGRAAAVAAAALFVLIVDMIMHRARRDIATTSFVPHAKKHRADIATLSGMPPNAVRVNTTPFPVLQAEDFAGLGFPPEATHNVAADARGNYVITWHRLEAPFDSNVYGQRFSVDGAPLGGEFLVNNVAAGYFLGPTVSMAPGGEFVIAFTRGWDRAVPEGGVGDDGIYARRYSSDGAPLGPQFLVNEGWTCQHQNEPAVTIRTDGSFIVTWHSRVRPRSYAITDDVMARCYDSEGMALAPEFLVSTTVVPDGQAKFPAIATNEAGDFIIVWQDGNESAGGRTTVRGQRFDALGAPLGGEFVITTDHVFRDDAPDIEMSADGSFVVVTAGVMENALGAVLHHFDASGARLGRPVLALRSHDFELAMDDDGNAVVAGTAYEPGLSQNSLTIQRVAANGELFGERIIVKHDELLDKRGTAVTLSRTGQAVIGWYSLAADTPFSRQDYRARRVHLGVE